MSESTNSVRSYAIGIEKVTPIKNSDNVTITGLLKGTIAFLDPILVLNRGDDYAKVYVGSVLNIRVDDFPALSASDTRIQLDVEGGANFDIKTGTVLFSQNVPEEEIRKMYIKALYLGYVESQRMNPDIVDFDKLTLTDLVELYELLKWMDTDNNNATTNDILCRKKEIFESLTSALCKNLLSCDGIYAMYNKKTGEPHLSSTICEDTTTGMISITCDIKLITKAYYSIQKDKSDLVLIENGEDKKGICNFLKDAYYRNGACGIRIISDRFNILTKNLIPMENRTDIPDEQITNPLLKGCLLLNYQIEEGKYPNEEKIRSIFATHILREMANAKFLMPMKAAESKVVLNPNGTKNGTFATIACGKGRGEKPMAFMYTDIKSLRKIFKEDEWAIQVSSIPAMINHFDIAVNYSQDPSTEAYYAAWYVDSDLYENHIKQFISKKV